MNSINVNENLKKNNQKQNKKIDKNIIIDNSKSNDKLKDNDKSKDNKNKLLNVKKIKDNIDFDDYSFQKPYLKWVGGKTQIMNKTVGNFPVEMNNYREIFLGGGSVLLTVLKLIEEDVIKLKRDVYAYDYNKQLIYTYKNVQNNYKKVLKNINKIIDEFNDITGEEINRDPNTIDEAKTSKESYYYWIRKKYNLSTETQQISFKGTAKFIFLNKTCFRGVFRTSKGKKHFNVPYGHYSKPGIIDEDSIKKISKLIKNVKFEHMSFEKSIELAENGDMLFCDSPYYPVNIKSFVGYTSDGFDKNMHNKFFEILKNLRKKNVNWVMSNSAVAYVIENFNNKEKYSMETLSCRRAINSKKPQSKETEVIIKNYE